MNRVRVKICGITRPVDAVEAAREGVDAIGLVFYGNSPRSVDADLAREIISRLPPFVCKVGLFVNADRGYVQFITDQVSLDLLQFHGEESAAECGSFRLPYIKAVRMHPGVNFVEISKRYADAAGILIDSYVEGIAGGTGKTFDWSRVPGQLGKPLVLAGGLTAENVREAVRQVRPYAVDVSGGVESSKGVKDRAKIAKFMDQIRRL